MTKEQLIINYQASRYTLTKRVQNATIKELSEFANWSEYHEVLKCAKELENHGYKEIIDQL